MGVLLAISVSLLLAATCISTAHLLRKINKLRNSSHMEFCWVQMTLLCGTAVSTILQTVFGTTILLVTSMRGGFPDRDGGGPLCRMEGFVTSASAFVIINQLTTLCMLTNLKTKSTANNSFKRPVVAAAVGVCWSLGVLLPSLPFVGVGEYVVQRGNQFCCLNWSSREVYDRWYFYILFCVEFIFPLLLILWSGVRGRQVQQGDGQLDSCLGSESVLLVAVVFLLLWFPYGVQVLCTLLGVHTLPSVELISLMVALSSFALTPLLLAKELRVATKV